MPGCELRLGNVRLRRPGKHTGLAPWVLPTLQCAAEVPSLAAVPALFPATDAYVLSQVGDVNHAACVGLRRTATQIVTSQNLRAGPMKSFSFPGTGGCGTGTDLQKQ